MTLSPLGDAAVVISLGERVDEAIARGVRGLVREIEGSRLAGVTDVVGAFASVAVFYDPVRAGGFAGLRAELEKAAERASAVDGEDKGRRIVLPVCYGGDHGPDLGAVAAHTRLSPEAVIAAHSGADYLVHAIGFVPGFPYLGGLPAELATPRRGTPRARVPAGAVGIGGVQTGVYPLETPGGWNLIGRTPARLFDVAREEAALLRAGDRVAFQPIDENEFAKLVTRTADGPRSTTTEGAEEADVCVVRGGMLTTVQDGGRVGHRAEGVPLSGAADPVALRVANLVVGNQEAAAALEFTLLGPELRFARDAIVALAGGADFGLPRWRPLRLAAGETLKIGAAAAGCRGYLAVAGGFAVSEVIGSRSTYLRGGFGGLGGRALRDGDGLHVAAVDRRVPGNGGNWRIDERVLPAYSAAPTVRVIKGAQAEEFSSAWIQEEFEVTTQSDRMGARLRGAALTRNRTAELVSAPVAPGTIQVPPDGQPIVLLADAQTIGGYPQIAHVITVDLPLVAQLRPGYRVRFTEVSLEEAQALLLARERALGMLREGLAQKLA